MPSETASPSKPVPSHTVKDQLAALTSHAGVYSLAGTGWLRVTGSDRLRWLAGMLTNGIQQTEPGTGTYNFILSAQGRIQGDCYAFVRENDVLLETEAGQVEPLQALLDRFIIMDDVELTTMPEMHGIGIAGPQAASLLTAVSFDANGIQPLQIRESDGLIVIHAYSPSVPRFEIWSSDASAIERLHAALLAAGAAGCGAEALEDLRILSGIPLYGTDIRDKDLPQETAQTRALHFAKGCYIGQEIVERIRSRGAVHRTFSSFVIEGELPAAGTALELDGKPVGEITSAAAIPFQHGEKKLALGYLRREALLQKKPLAYAGGSAMPADLPLALENS